MSDPAPTPDPLDRDVRAVIERRRTSLLQDPDRPVPADQVADLIRAATLAPNHKRTWPWRFTVLAGDARRELGACLATAAREQGAGQAQEDKLRTKYLRSPVVLLVWALRSADPVRAREDRDAVAAAAQTLLLAATGEGLASYWGSVPDTLIPATRQVANVADDHDLVALVYLGWPTGEVAMPPRPDPQITFLG